MNSNIAVRTAMLIVAHSKHQIKFFSEQIANEIHCISREYDSVVSSMHTSETHEAQQITKPSALWVPTSNQICLKDVSKSYLEKF